MDPSHDPGPVLGFLILFGSLAIILALAAGWMWLKMRLKRKRE
jgi:hypothetical protein